MDLKIRRKNTPVYTKPPMSVVSTSMEGNVKILIPFLQDLFGLSLRKKQSRHVGQAARFLDEVNMGVDENTNMEAGRL